MSHRAPVEPARQGEKEGEEPANRGEDALMQDRWIADGDVPRGPYSLDELDPVRPEGDTRRVAVTEVCA